MAFADISPVVIKIAAPGVQDSISPLVAVVASVVVVASIAVAVLTAICVAAPTVYDSTILRGGEGLGTPDLHTREHLSLLRHGDSVFPLVIRIAFRCCVDVYEYGKKSSWSHAELSCS